RNFECCRDFVTERVSRCSCRDKNTGTQGKWQRRRVENMRPLPVLFPPNELFCQKSHRDHQQLNGKPCGLEPEEQVNTQNNRPWAESERIWSLPRPRKQDVEGVREHKLCGDQWNFCVYRTPVPSPIQQD